MQNLSRKQILDLDIASEKVRTLEMFLFKLGIGVNIKPIKCYILALKLLSRGSSNNVV